jgi:hypothetical protein
MRFDTVLAVKGSNRKKNKKKQQSYLRQHPVKLASKAILFGASGY